MNHSRISLFTLCLCTLLIFLGCGRDTDGAEQAAIRFYKSVWVNGDMNEASGMLQNKSDLKEIAWRISDTRREARDSNPDILIVESPTERVIGRYKTFLIHRPADKRDFKVRVRKENGSWRVIKFEQNYVDHQGGYISGDAYQRLKAEFPGLKWKRVENP
jgi:hypothetical protein